jgi:hypothetical protein
MWVVTRSSLPILLILVKPSMRFPRNNEIEPPRKRGMSGYLGVFPDFFPWFSPEVPLCPPAVRTSFGQEPRLVVAKKSAIGFVLRSSPQCCPYSNRASVTPLTRACSRALPVVASFGWFPPTPSSILSRNLHEVYVCGACMCTTLVAEQMRFWRRM